MCMLAGEVKGGKGIDIILRRNSRGISASQLPLSPFIDTSLEKQRPISDLHGMRKGVWQLVPEPYSRLSEPKALPDSLDWTARQLWVGLVWVCLHFTTKLHRVFAQVQTFPLILCEMF